MRLRMVLPPLAVWALAILLPVAVRAADTHQGKVVSSEEGKLTMTDLEGINEHTHQLGDDVQITLDGQEASADDLEAGLEVTVTTDTKDGETVVTSIEARSDSQIAEPRQPGRRDAGRTREGRRDRGPEGRRQARGYLGVTLDSGRPQGAWVVDVAPRSPADEAGIRPGDELRSVDDQEISSPQQLVELIGQKEPGASVRLEIARRGEQSSEEVTLAQRPQRRQRPQFDPGFGGRRSAFRPPDERYGVPGQDRPRLGGGEIEQLRQTVRQLQQEVQQLRQEMRQLRSRQQGGLEGPPEGATSPAQPGDARGTERGEPSDRLIPPEAGAPEEPGLAPPQP